MSKKHSRSGYRGLAISTTISCLLLLWSLIFIESLTVPLLWTRLAKPLLTLMVLIGLGLIFAQVIEAKGWTEKLGILAGPIFKFANLGPKCSAVFSTAFFSGVAANAMLVDFYKEGKISKKQVYLTNFINQFPAYFLHLPTTFFIVVPLTKAAGLLYFGLTFLAVVLRSVLFLLFGRYFLNPSNCDFHPKDPVFIPENKKQIHNVFSSLKKNFPGRFTKIVIYVVPIYIVIFLINIMGGFDSVRDWIAGYITMTFVPVEALSVVILSFVAEFSSGFAAAGALLDARVISTRETVLALLIGNVIAFPIRALRHQLPRYMGIFSPGMGAQILLLGQIFRVISIIAVGIGYYFLSLVFK
jgi:hypothetical protein